MKRLLVLGDGDPVMLAADRVDDVASRRGEHLEAFAAAVTEPTADEAGSWRSALTNVRLQRRYVLDPLVPDTLSLRADAARAPDCARCTDRCCADPHNETSLRLDDVWLLREAGLEAAVVAPPRHAASQPALAALERRDSYRRFPVLAKRPDGACVFLDENGRCGIYALRPRQCRRFPHRLADDRAAVDWNARCAEPGAPLDEEAQQALVRRVTDDDTAKIRDLVTLTHGRRALEATGLAALLPDIDDRG